MEKRGEGRKRKVPGEREEEILTDRMRERKEEEKIESDK